MENLDVEAEEMLVSIGWLTKEQLNECRKDASEKNLPIDADKGYLLVDENMETNIKGIYACGDIRKKQLRQVVTAVSDGAVAAHFAEEYLNKNKKLSKKLFSFRYTL